MSNPKHTPGPWTVDDMLARYIYVKNNQQDVARVETFADARLIASAPMLLEALATISDLLLDRNMGVGNMDDETLCETIGDIVTVAMGKATGGSNE